MEDKMIICEDCGEEFTFSADEQQFYAERGFQQPKRCKPCREKRKRDRRSSYSMGDRGRGRSR
ncbi:MAG: cytochrome C551 [Calditrichaeota bacterium]|nr:MAG: cytochrome C551 [Calditrichota bacterium]